MPLSHVDTSFVRPSLLAQIIRKNEFVSLDQLPLAMRAMGFPETGLYPRIRAALASLLRESPSEFRLGVAHAHPGAIDSWGVAWSSYMRGRTRLFERVPGSIRLNWNRERAVSRLKVVRINDHNPDAVSLDAWRRTTAKILRTSVWIELLQRDPTAAKSWQVIEHVQVPYLYEGAAALYTNSKGHQVFALVPVLSYWHDEDDDGFSDLNRILRFARKRKWKIEIFSLKFPNAIWPDQPSRFEERMERLNELDRLEILKQMTLLGHALEQWRDEEPDSFGDEFTSQ